MDFLETRPSRQLFYLTVCISLLVHVVVLLLPAAAPPASKPPQRLSVRMMPKTPGPTKQAITTPPPTVMLSPQPGRAAPRIHKVPVAPSQPILSSPEPGPAVVEQPKYTQAERDDIDNFLQSLGPEAKPQARANPRANVSDRSMAMARDIGREMARRGDGSAISLERIPDSPPVDRFSLEFYLDSLMNKLNRNAQFMKRPAGGGRQTAAIQLRINPDGSMKSVEVLDESDQKDEVEFIKHLLERSAPYSPFPSTLAASARSLAITICIRPGRGGDSSFSRFERGSGSSC
ncbi:TonB C-terminal domain-containing protein [Uliginosibacterium sp. H3]|uniref:TonB C-terminal domain-containing protein n=1 Tax=Uliginosibacterium silvisoli TaxID=3114758 RepID=A0ABU6K8A5_9RHOO|nr:TonB C-terminal domain-containing protein [Uliginosibacterium sp. H3]